MILAGIEYVSFVRNLKSVVMKWKVCNIRSVCCTSSGTTVVVGQESGCIVVFHIPSIGFFDCLGLHSPRPLNLKVFRAHNRDITALSINAADTYCVSASLDWHMKIWSVPSFELIQCIDHPNFVWSVCFGPKDCIISGSHDGTVRVWDFQVDDDHLYLLLPVTKL